MKLSYYTYQFRHYLGRNLTRAEAAVIGPLEIMRIRRRQRRLLVIDPPGVDSRSILIQYLRYIRAIYSPDSDILVLAPHRKTAADLATPLRTPAAATYTAAGRYPDRVRGLTYSIALLLDIQDYGRYSPARIDNQFHRISAAIFPVILSTPGGILILHARSQTPYLHRWAALCTPADPALAPPDLPPPLPPPYLPPLSPPFLILNSPFLILNSPFLILNSPFLTLNSPSAAVIPARLNRPNRCHGSFDVVCLFNPGMNAAKGTD